MRRAFLHALPAESAILTSDDVFETMLDLRAINEGIDRRRDELFAEAQNAKYSKFQLRSLDDYDRLKQVSKRAGSASPAMCGRG